MNAPRITPENFARYGRVARLPGEPPLAGDAAFSYWSEAAFFHVEGETDVGYCTVYAQPAPAVAWVEKHDRSPEVVIPIDGAVLLPVVGSGEGDAVEVFEVRPGEAAIVGAGVWHSACHPAGGQAATYFVLFRRGTPREDVVKKDIAAVALSR